MSEQVTGTASKLEYLSRAPYDIGINVVGTILTSGLFWWLGYVGGGLSMQQSLQLACAVLIAMVVASLAWHFATRVLIRRTSPRLAYLIFLAATALVIAWILVVARYLAVMGPVTVVPATNRLTIQQDFEKSTDGWTEQVLERLSDDGTAVVSQSRDSAAIKSGLTQDHALTGDQSLRITATADSAGLYKGIIDYKQPVTAHGASIYFLVPQQEGMSVDYVQLCVPSMGWICSHGTDVSPGQWVPLDIDLSDLYENAPIYERTINELAVQWRFRTDRKGAYEFFFDGGEIRTAGSE